MVESESKEDTVYRVDMPNNFCECPQGRTKANCKHKIAVMVHHGVAEMAVLPLTDMAARSMWHYIAYGVVMEDSFYRPLNKPDATANIQEYLAAHKADTHTEAEDDTGPEPDAGETSYFTFPSDEVEAGPAEATSADDEDEEDDDYDFEAEKEKLWQKYKQSQEALDNRWRTN